jgi:hypothetical protein
LTALLSPLALGRLVHLKQGPEGLIVGAGHCLDGPFALLPPQALASLAIFAQSRFEALTRQWRLETTSRLPRAAVLGWMFLICVFLPREP